MSDEESNGLIPSNEVPEDDQNVLLTEYRQAGEEVRNRDRLIHNGYYILITVTAVLLWQIVRVRDNGGQIAVLWTGGGFLYMLLGFVIIEHFRKRRSAWNLQSRVEMIFAGKYKGVLSGEDASELVTYPLSLQHHASGEGIVWNVGGKGKEDGPDAGFEKAPTLFGEFFTWPSNKFSARTIGQLVILAGVGLFVLGLICGLF